MRSPLLWLALALHLALASAYAWRTPHFEGPDENSHYEYGWFLANKGSLPLTASVQQQRGLLQTEAAVLAHHPPLYYSLIAAAMLASGETDVVFAPRQNPGFGAAEEAGGALHFLHERAPAPLLNWLRMISALLGGVTVVAVHRLGRACCPRAPRVADLAALLVACLPMWSALHGVLNNDVLAATLSALTLLALVRTAQRERVRARDAGWVGLLLGLAWLTKLTTLFLGGLAALTALVLWLRGRARLHTLLLGGAGAAAVSGWWFWRNLELHGDLLGMSAHDASFQPLPAELRWPYLLGLDTSGPAFTPELFASLFGRFGWFSVPPHPFLPWCGAAVTAIALVGLLQAWFDRDRVFRPRAAWLLIAACAAVFAGTAYFNYTSYQPQARLLFPAAAPGAVLLAAGLVRFSAGAVFRRAAIALLPLAAAAVFFGTFAKPLAPALARGPADHRSLVGGIVEPAVAPSIRWLTAAPTAPQAAAPTLRWRDPGAAPETRYTLYAFDAAGRVWLATHEWTAGNLAIGGDSYALPDVVWGFLPVGVPLSLRLRRVPADEVERPRDLPCTPPLTITRRRP